MENHIPFSDHAVFQSRQIEQRCIAGKIFLKILQVMKRKMTFRFFPAAGVDLTVGKCVIPDFVKTVGINFKKAGLPQKIVFPNRNMRCETDGVNKIGVIISS